MRFEPPSLLERFGRHRVLSTHWLAAGTFQHRRTNQGGEEGVDQGIERQQDSCSRSTTAVSVTRRVTGSNKHAWTRVDVLHTADVKPLGTKVCTGGSPMNQTSRAIGRRDGSRIQYGFVCVLMAFSHLQFRWMMRHSTGRAKHTRAQATDTAIKLCRYRSQGSERRTYTAAA